VDEVQGRNDFKYVILSSQFCTLTIAESILRS